MNSYDIYVSATCCLVILGRVNYIRDKYSSENNFRGLLSFVIILCTLRFSFYSKDQPLFPPLQKITKEVYRSRAQFMDDVELIVANCYSYKYDVCHEYFLVATVRAIFSHLQFTRPSPLVHPSS